MPDLCGKAHPDRPEVTCDKDIPCWGFHANVRADVEWDGLPLPTKETKEQAKERLRVARDKTAPADTTGRPVLEVQQPSGEVLKAWEEVAGNWIGHAKKVLYEYCKEHALFTTREVWLLLDNPPGTDRRKMVVVTRHAVTQGWMAESGQYERQTEPYMTRDGISFPMNKPVPIYRSRLVR
jgi:hypothetical protein